MVQLGIPMITLTTASKASAGTHSGLSIPAIIIVAVCSVPLFSTITAIAAESVDLSDHFVLTRVKHGGRSHLDLQVRQPDGKLSYIGSIPDPGYERLVFDRLSGIKGNDGAPLFGISADGRSVAFFHQSRLSNRRSGPESGVYFYGYEQGLRLLQPGENFLGLPSSQRTDVPGDVLTFTLDKDAGVRVSVPWAIRLTTDGPEQFPLALLGATDLHRAAYVGDSAKIVQLLDDGQDINVHTYWGHTPLYVAIASDQEQAAIDLIGRGADYTTGSSSHLHLAVTNGHSRLAEAMIELGENVNRVDSSGRTALHTASELQRSGVSDVFRQRELLSPEAALRRVAILLEYGADPNAKTDAGDSAFHFLARIEAHPDLPIWVNQAAKLLIDAGADAAMPNSQGNSPLHVFCRGWNFAPLRSERAFAAEVGRWEQSEARAMLALLVSSMPDIDARNTDGATPLQLALGSNHMLTARYLVAHGADDRVPDAHGVSARDRIDRAFASDGWRPPSPPMEADREND